MNGRSTTTGVAKLAAKDSHSLSAPIFDAEYGDWPCSGWASVMGNVAGVQAPIRVENIKAGDVPTIDVAPAWLAVGEKK